MGAATSVVRIYRERGILAQRWAAEAPTDGLRSLWLELAERYFELADEYDAESPLSFHARKHKLRRRTPDQLYPARLP